MKPSYRDISILCNGLSSIINSGITITQAINIIASQTEKSILKKSLYDIEKKIVKGESLYDSLKKYHNVYPLFMIEMINLGEKTGKIDKILEEMSEYYEKQYRIFTKIRSAIYYPMIVLIISIIIVIFLMTKIVPQFIDMLKAVDGEIPIITNIVIQCSNFLDKNSLPINLVLFMSVFFVYSISKNDKFKIYFHMIKMNSPILGTFYNKVILSRLAIIISMLLTSGFTITKALEIAGTVINNKVIEEKIYNCIRHIKKGESIYFSFKNNNLGNKLFLSLVHIGEECGNLDYMLHKVGKILEEDVDASLKKIIVLIEPITILFLAFFIGIFVVAGLLPIVSIMDSIK